MKGYICGQLVTTNFIMKKLFLLPLLALSLTFISCGDDDGDCVQSDFVGTYLGTKSVSGIETQEDFTFEVTAAGSSQISVFGAIENIDISGCKIEGGTKVLGFGNEYSGSLDGTTITINEVVSAAGIDAITTTWTGVKQ